ncbi:putative transmembrane protein [Toxoplasma gondii MAS]|uniref:Putative transmembrane protein n=1 Tax=Toxoplasma gondii MAS TaxID=943118 RepID=A0A086QWB3_TOXGO|nr:putative transmembrane protein [Toxoplasma gondii MAS]
MATAEPGTPSGAVDASGREAQAAAAPSDLHSGWLPRSFQSSDPTSSLCLRLAVAAPSQEGRKEDLSPSSPPPASANPAPRSSFQGQPPRSQAPRTVSFQLPSASSSLETCSLRPLPASPHAPHCLFSSTSPSAARYASMSSCSASPGAAPLHSRSSPCLSGPRSWSLSPDSAYSLTHSISAPVPEALALDGDRGADAFRGLLRRVSDADSDCSGHLTEASVEHGSCCGSLCRGYHAPTKWDLHMFFSGCLLAFACVLFCAEHVAAGLALCALAAVALGLVRAQRRAISLHLLLLLTLCACVLAAAWAIREAREIERTELLQKQERLFTRHLAALERRAETLRASGAAEADVAREAAEIEERRRTALALLRQAAMQTRRNKAAHARAEKPLEKRRQDQFLASSIAVVLLLFSLFLLNFVVAGYLGYLPFYFFVYQNLTVAFFSFRGAYAGLLCGATPAICFLLFCLEAYLAAWVLVPLLLLTLGLGLCAQVSAGRRAAARRPARSPSESTVSSDARQLQASPEPCEKAERRRRRNSLLRLFFETLLVVAVAVVMVVHGILLPHCVRELNEKTDAEEKLPLGDGAEAQEAGDSEAQDVLSLYRAEALFSLLLCQELILLLSLLLLLPRLVLMCMQHRDAWRNKGVEGLGRTLEKPRRSSLALLLLGAPCPSTSERERMHCKKGATDTGPRQPLTPRNLDIEEGQKTDKRESQALDDVEAEFIGRYEVRRNGRDDSYEFR